MIYTPDTLSQKAFPPQDLPREARCIACLAMNKVIESNPTISEDELLIVGWEAIQEKYELLDGTAGWIKKISIYQSEAECPDYAY